jgi:hypothetical protein
MHSKRRMSMPICVELRRRDSEDFVIEQTAADTVGDQFSIDPIEYRPVCFVADDGVFTSEDCRTISSRARRATRIM